MRKKEDTIELTKEEKKKAVDKLKEYIETELDADIEIGNLQTEIFLDFISKNIGVYYYNKGVADSLSFMTEKLDDFYLLMKDDD